LQSFREGVLAVVFDSLDRIQHMFWRDRPDIVEDWYMKLDALLGRVEHQLEQLGEKPKTVIVSDHGFADFDHKVHLNRWLVDRGFLAVRTDGTNGSLREVDWSQSQAYAVGLNSVYINLRGREGQGCVTEEEYESLVHKLCHEMSIWRGPSGSPVLQQASSRDEVFEGSLTEHGPDIVVGYSPGYRASAETGLGEWGENSIEPNRDHWGGDHCMDQAAVPGILFSRRGLSDFPNPSYRDIPALTIGAELEGSDLQPPPSWAEEDQEIIEERLRGLGYL
jgi:predicted AlkP superfamily phosphohydrolase/phosphomutase